VSSRSTPTPPERAASSHRQPPACARPDDAKERTRCCSCFRVHRQSFAETNYYYFGLQGTTHRAAASERTGGCG
jgi:hypothetical protein